MLARIGKRWDGAHTRRGVHGIPELTMGCMVIELHSARIGKPEDGAHTRRGVHGVLELIMGCVW